MRISEWRIKESKARYISELFFDNYSFGFNYLDYYVCCHLGFVHRCWWDSSGREEGFMLKALARKCTRIYSCDLSTQDWIDKSLLTGEEALPLVICKCETVAIREE